MAVRLQLASNETLTETFSRGIVRDLSPALIPEGGVYDAADFLFDRAGMVYKRGGSAEHSSSCGAATRGVTVAILEPPNRILLACEDEVLYDVTSEHTPDSTTIGSVGFTTSENPPLYVGRVILTDDDAQYSGLGVAPKKVYFDYPDVILADLGGFPPAAFRSCVHVDRILLARTFDNPNRIWFSPFPAVEGSSIAVAAATSTAFVLSGDHTADIPAGRTIVVDGSTSNDGSYTVTSSSFTAGDTTVVVTPVPPSTSGTMGNMVVGWDTANAWLDTTYEITGMASFQGALFVFSAHAIERVLGSVPPGAGVLTDNLTLQPHAHIGCSDARSIVVTDQGIVFANADGVFITTSGNPTALSERSDGSGISGYWRSLFSDTDSRGIACGMLNRDYLAVSVFTPTLGAPTLIAGFLYHFPSGAWTRITNVLGVSYASGNSRNNTPYAELYAALGDAPKSVRLSTFLQPGLSRNDSDGDPVEPFLRTRPLGAGPGLKAYGDAHLTYYMPDAGGDNPTLAVTIDRGLLITSTKTPAASPLPETVAVHRKRLTVGVDSNAVAFEFEQFGASQKTELYFLEADVRPYDRESTGQ